MGHAASPARGSLTALPVAAMESDVRRAMRGDRAAFAALYHSRVRPVGATLSCLTGAATPPPEVVATVFERAWRALPGLPAPAQFDAWLLRIVEDVAWDLVSSGNPTGGSEVAPHDTTADLARHVRDLAARHRQVILLRTLFRMSVERTAIALNATPQDVADLERQALEYLAE